MEIPYIPQYGVVYSGNQIAKRTKIC